MLNFEWNADLGVNLTFNTQHSTLLFFAAKAAKHAKKENKTEFLSQLMTFYTALRSNALTRLRSNGVKRTMPLCKVVFDPTTSR
jgi:hypothetical protein